MNQNTTNSPPLIDKTKEAAKGYWTDDEPRGISVVVTKLQNDITRVSLNSEYWYRVQHFDVQEKEEDNVKRVWNLVKEVFVTQGGRTLVPQIVEIPGEEEGEVIQHIEYYRVAYLSEKQTNQLYYLLKHALTTAGLSFTMSHSFFGGMDTVNSIPLPKKRRRAKKKQHIIAIQM